MALGWLLLHATNHVILQLHSDQNKWHSCTPRRAHHLQHLFLIAFDQVTHLLRAATWWQFHQHSAIWPLRPSPETNHDTISSLRIFLFGVGKTNKYVVSLCILRPLCLSWGCRHPIQGLPFLPDWPASLNDRWVSRYVICCLAPETLSSCLTQSRQAPWIAANRPCNLPWTPTRSTNSSKKSDVSFFSRGSATCSPIV